MDPLVALGDHGPHAEQVRPLRRPVARRAGAVLLAGEDDERRPLGEVALGRLEDRHLLAATGSARVHVPSEPGTSRLRSRTFANVPRTITSWLPRREPYELKSRALDAVLDQVAAGRRVGLDRARRRDVVGRDRVAERDEAAGAVDVGDRRRARADSPSKYGGRRT